MNFPLPDMECLLLVAAFQLPFSSLPFSKNCRKPHSEAVFYPSCNFDRRVCWTLTKIQTSFDVYWQGDNHRKLIRKFWAQLKSWTDFEYWDQSEEPLVGLFIDSLVWWDGQSKSPLCYSHLFTSAINSSILSITIIAFIIMLTCFLSPPPPSPTSQNFFNPSLSWFWLGGPKR